MADTQSPDLFQDHASEWDSQAVPARISEGVGAALRLKVPLSPEMRVMDFGAGTGLVASHIAPHVKILHAVDISAAMLEKLAAKPELAGHVEIHCQDILQSPLATEVDLIISAMAMHHVADTGLMLRTFAQHLTPGGRVALADLDAEDGTFHPEGMEGVFHHGFDRDALGQSLRNSGFVDVDFATAVRVERGGKDFPVFLVTATKA